jgi:hypothetical protein
MRALRGGAMLSDYLESLVNEISNILTSFRHSIYEIVLYVLRKRHFKRHFSAALGNGSANLHLDICDL